MLSRIIAITLVSMLVSQAAAGGFLELAKVSTSELESSLLAELTQAVNSSNSDQHERIVSLQTMLQPMYAAVPQEADGTISHAVVRYVLHRFFAKHRGWFVRGLEPRGATKNETQALQDMQEWVPDYLQDFLEKVIGKTLSLRDLAIFAATLEDFVHKEEHAWLTQVYNILWHPVDSKLSKNKVKELLQTYLMLYNLDGDIKAPSPTKVQEMLKMFVKKVKGWPETVEWLTKLLDDKWGSDTARQADFKEVEAIVQAVGQGYGEFNDGECLKMKNELLSVESQKPGRVKLTDFYKKSLYGTWEFNEKIDYLRSLGTLDESDPKTPLVILPNYVASRPQCLTSSSYYAVCCRNECEDLMGALERDIQHSQAEPAQIVKLVETLASHTVTAPRSISSALRSRLDDVAKTNYGKVPLHGRLFAQWMHHAFPRECPFPHVGGTANPQTADEWMKENGQQDAKASEQEMLSQVENDSCKYTPKGVVCGGKKKGEDSQKPEAEEEEASVDLPWSQEEELLVVRAAPVPEASLSQKYMRDFMVYVALFSMVSFMAWATKDVLATMLHLPLSSNKKSDCCRV